MPSSLLVSSGLLGENCNSDKAIAQVHCVPPLWELFPNLLVTQQRHHGAQNVDKHWSQPGMLAPPLTSWVTYAKAAHLLGTQRTVAIVMR